MRTTTTKSRFNSVLGLALEGHRVDGVVLRRQNGGAEITARVNATLTMDLVANDPELFGQELRNALDAAEVRERRCSLCLPLSWVLVSQSQLPDLPEKDLIGFLQIEAERAFPYGLDALVLATSRFTSPQGVKFATQIAVPRDHLTRLDAALRVARLIPMGYFLGPTLLQNAEDDAASASLSLCVGEFNLGLQATGGGGVIALRAFDLPLAVEGEDSGISADGLARELRITLGQMPAGLRAPLNRCWVFGSGQRVDQFISDLRPKLHSLGLAVEQGRAPSQQEIGLSLPSGTPATPAVIAAARALADRLPSLNFLPPRTNAWKQFTAKYSSKTLLYSGIAAAGITIAVITAFAAQQVQLVKLRTRWEKMSKPVKELESIQQQIKRFRPWFDDSFHSLSILRRLTEVFPEDGGLTAKSIEIRDGSGVSCAGTAKDSQVLYRTLDQLRTSRDVTEVQVDQLRGKAPIQFSFNFQWGDRSQP